MYLSAHSQPKVSMNSLLSFISPSQMNASYGMLGIKLYLANVQGKILSGSGAFTLAGSTEQLAWQRRPSHS